MSNFAERLQFAFEQVGLAPSKAATEINLSAQAAQKWKKGQISLDNLIKIIELTNVDANWLLMGDKTRKTQHINNNGMFIAGDNHGTQTQNNYHNGGDDSGWFVVSDRALFPVFSIGDRVHIDKQREPQAGNYVLADYDGQTFLRKYRPKGFDENGVSYVQLVAENEDYPVIDSRYQVFAILGVAVIHQRNLV